MQLTVNLKRKSEEKTRHSKLARQVTNQATVPIASLVTELGVHVMVMCFCRAHPLADQDIPWRRSYPQETFKNARLWYVT